MSLAEVREVIFSHFATEPPVYLKDMLCKYAFTECGHQFLYGQKYPLWVFRIGGDSEEALLHFIIPGEDVVYQLPEGLFDIMENCENTQTVRMSDGDYVVCTHHPQNPCLLLRK